MFTEFELFAKVCHDEVGWDASDPSFKTSASIFQTILQQYARRIIFHEPNLFFKSLDKVSFKDLILSDDFSNEDAVRFALMFEKKLGFGLVWLKDAVLDAFVISKGGIAANIGKLGK